MRRKGSLFLALILVLSMACGGMVMADTAARTENDGGIAESSASEDSSDEDSSDEDSSDEDSSDVSSDEDSSDENSSDEDSSDESSADGSSQVSSDQDMTAADTASAVMSCEIVSVNGGTVVLQTNFVPESVSVALPDAQSGNSYTWLEDGVDFTWSYNENTGSLTVSLTDTCLNSIEEGTYSFLFLADTDGESTGAAADITIVHAAEDASDTKDTGTAEDAGDTESTNVTEDTADSADTGNADDAEEIDAAQTGDAGRMPYFLLLAAAGGALICVLAAYFRTVFRRI